MMARTARSALPSEMLSRVKSRFPVPMRDRMQTFALAPPEDRSARGPRVGRGGFMPDMPAEQIRLLVFTTGAYGCRGGIAQFNRDMLASIATMPGARIVALPRIAAEQCGDLPDNIDFRVSSAGGKLRYGYEALRAINDGRQDLIVCGHLNLLPIAALAARRHRAPLVLVIYGVEAWRRHPSRGVRRALPSVARVVSISDHTWRRFMTWSGANARCGVLIPCCVDGDAFTPGPKPEYLLDRHDLRDKHVVLTIARLADTERYKGIDEILEVLPGVVGDWPDVRYVIAGEGSDRPRLEAKVRALRLNDIVRFAGYVSEAEKADYYRSADVFAMPSQGEGFGIVFLEAVACGIPVVASMLDASRETVLGGELGLLVDPRDRRSIQAGLLAALRMPRRAVAHPALSRYDRPTFVSRWHSVIRETVGATRQTEGRT
jgi:glycosyltransferase involved in cell wall biosynthesis